jgi:5-methyltetrahydropteroyltriglutamate--homocysteine methyltransferase
MPRELFPAQEIGSLSKPNWRVLGYRGVPISDSDFSEAKYWGKKLKIEGYEKLLEYLKSDDSPEVRERIREWSAIYALRYLESAGLDIVYDGEQWRTEMYEALVKEVEGFKFIGHVRSWDNKYYRKAAVVSEIRWRSPIYLDEYLFTRAHTSRIVKLPFTGPYTVTDWSFNEYYQKRLEGTCPDPRELKKKAYTELLFEVSRKLIRPEISSLVSSGVKWIQIDEPALSTQPGKEQISNFVQAINEAIQGFDCKFSLHVCYSTDYTAMFPELLEARNISQYALEFANRDSNRIGRARRIGYDVVKLLREYGAGKEIGLGVVDVHDDRIESPNLVRERILHASDLIGDPGLVYVNPDCGLRTRTWKVAYSKLQNMVRGAELARRSLS